MLTSITRRLIRMRGFTMIELLVVIAIIGVLAVAVLSAINPIEQINKGRDTRTRSDAAELLSATERYFSTQELYPWNVASAANPSGATIPANVSAGAVGVAFVGDATAGRFNFLGSLVESNEVKPAFGTRLYSSYGTQVAGSETFVVLKALNSDAVSVCFLPTSTQFKLEAAKRCCASNAGPAGSICTSSGTMAGLQPLTIAGVTVCANSTGANWQAAATRNLICLP